MASSQPQKDDNKPAASAEAGKPEEVNKKSATALEEDDEFEDFPVEGTLPWIACSLASSEPVRHTREETRLTLPFVFVDWPAEETEAAATKGGETTKHLWEESWDDDDTSDDFSQQLKYVLSIDCAQIPRNNASTRPTAGAQSGCSTSAHSLSMGVMAKLCLQSTGKN